MRGFQQWYGSDPFINDTEDEKGTIYNGEMQKSKNKNLTKRSQYDQGSIDLDMIAKGEDFNKRLHVSVYNLLCVWSM